MFNRRLSKTRKAALNIPELPKGYYWVMRETKPIESSQLCIRKHKLCIFWYTKQYHWEYLNGKIGDRPSRETYQHAIDSVYSDFSRKLAEEQKVKDTWESWSGAPVTVEDEVRKALSNA